MMTLQEAYEIFDLPEGADLQKVRQCFIEQHNEYRMQIDNAPTPNLRQRYEKNLALREVAYALITGGSSLDDSQDLPATAPFEAEQPQQSEAIDNAVNKANVHADDISLSDAFAMMGVQKTSSPSQINSAYLSLKAELEVDLARAGSETIKDAYKTELSKLQQAWLLVEPLILAGISNPQNQEMGKQPSFPKSPSAENKPPQTFNYTFGVLQILILLSVLPFLLLPLNYAVVFAPLALTIIGYLLALISVNLMVRGKTQMTFLWKPMPAKQFLLDAILTLVVASVFTGCLFLAGKASQDYIMWGCSFENVFLGFGMLISVFFMLSVIPFFVGMSKPAIFKFSDRQSYLKFALFYFIAPLFCSGFVLGLTKLIAGSLRGSCL
jgi:hypothetical protein